VRAMGCGIEVPAQRVLAGGVIVYVDKESFYRLLELKEKPFCIVGELSSAGFGLKKTKVTIIPFEGALIVYRGEVELPEKCILVKASEISISK